MVLLGAPPVLNPALAVTPNSICITQDFHGIRSCKFKPYINRICIPNIFPVRGLTSSWIRLPQVSLLLAIPFSNLITITHHLPFLSPTQSLLRFIINQILPFLPWSSPPLCSYLFHCQNFNHLYFSFFQHLPKPPQMLFPKPPLHPLYIPFLKQPSYACWNCKLDNEIRIGLGWKPPRTYT